jgi:hypothetical protein
LSPLALEGFMILTPVSLGAVLRGTALIAVAEGCVMGGIDAVAGVALAGRANAFDEEDRGCDFACGIGISAWGRAGGGFLGKDGCNAMDALVPTGSPSSWASFASINAILSAVLRGISIAPRDVM